MAPEIGFRVVVADARPAWATAERFPGVDRLVVGWPDVVFDELELDRRTYVVMLSHDSRFEDPVFRTVRTAPVRYVGALGSRRTHGMRLDRLRGEGWTDEELARIHAPIGIDIGAEQPAEVAVSILAEMVRVRYGAGTGVSLRGTDGRIHSQRAD
jgi:xanthine dehydrogenase accessory factor